MDGSDLERSGAECPDKRGRRRLAIIVAVGIICAFAAAALPMVKVDPNREFDEAFAEADRIEVRGCLLDFIDTPQQMPVASIEGPAAIAELAEAFDLLPFARGGRTHCRCSGDERVDFFKAGKVADSFTIHHGRHIRWSRYRTDIELTAESQAKLAETLERLGIRPCTIDLPE